MEGNFSHYKGEICHNYVKRGVGFEIPSSSTEFRSSCPLSASRRVPPSQLQSFPTLPIFCGLPQAPSGLECSSPAVSVDADVEDNC